MHRFKGRSENNSPRALVIFLVTKDNWYSFAPLLGMLETSAETFKKSEIVICQNFKECLYQLFLKHKLFNKVIVLFSFFSTQINDVMIFFREIKNVKKHLHKK